MGGNPEAPFYEPQFGTLKRLVSVRGSGEMIAPFWERFPAGFRAGSYIDKCSFMGSMSQFRTIPDDAAGEGP
jgi:hypothetical protein